jgi:hypothetical protein
MLVIVTLGVLKRLTIFVFYVNTFKNFLLWSYITTAGQHIMLIESTVSIDRTYKEICLESVPL